MRNKLKELRALNAFAKKQSVGMQRKLMLYWVSMILVIFAAVCGGDPPFVRCRGLFSKR